MNELREKVFELIDQWHEQTMFHSMYHCMVEVQPYQDLIDLGRPAVPFIIEYLKKDPCHIYIALHELLPGVDPIQPGHIEPVCEGHMVGIKVDKVIQDWITWYDTIGYTEFVS